MIIDNTCHSPTEETKVKKKQGFRNLSSSSSAVRQAIVIDVRQRALRNDDNAKLSAEATISRSMSAKSLTEPDSKAQSKDLETSGDIFAISNRIGDKEYAKIDVDGKKSEQISLEQDVETAAVLTANPSKVSLPTVELIEADSKSVSSQHLHDSLGALAGQIMVAFEVCCFFS